MQINTTDTGSPLLLKNFRDSFYLTWLFVGIGLLALFLFILLAQVMPKKSYFFYFFQNVGIFLSFTSLLLAFAGVYMITTSPENAASIRKNATRATFRKSPYILGISLAMVFTIMLVLFIEVGISSVGHIPYAGPVIMTLLTVPIFAVNFFLMLTSICVFAVFPPLVSEAESLKGILLELKISIKERWLNVLVYLIISLSLLFLSLLIIYYLVRYAGGLTKSVQWKVEMAYPKVIKFFTMESLFTDIINSITPRSDSAAALKTYGPEIFDYLSILRYLISASYLVIFSFIISFPLAVYFNISSMFFGKVKGR
ncbi:MAG: hypothetical protein CVV44_14590 [Spirochaetae bacterium HGW-Spirochaetae-1]|jgi:hypothetical protein|nr:MAG: hypothetical protein CVV44_14590 [Spirochaetae bacterium HGW-Spirochaetae-1]